MIDISYAMTIELNISEEVIDGIGATHFHIP